MTNTIPNVPRYRVEKTGRGFWPYCVRAGDGTREVFVGHQKQCAVVAAELETAFEDGKFVSCIAPSPAGVDGLEVRAYEDSGGALYTAKLLEIMAVDSVGCEPLCRLTDAQAIIDGLRGEVAAQRIKTCTALKERNDAREERDQQARRIGELEGLLDHASKYIAPGAVLTLIKSTLSAGKDVQ